MICCAFMAPDCRAASLPDWNKIIVGIPEIPNREADWGAASVSSFANIQFGDSWAAASANAGAIIRHGPHQGAQKSTSIGTSVRDTNFANVSSVRSMGYRGRSDCLHLPQIGRSWILDTGTRFKEPHCEQTTPDFCITSLYLFAHRPNLDFWLGQERQYSACKALFSPAGCILLLIAGGYSRRMQADSRRASPIC